MHYFGGEYRWDFRLKVFHLTFEDIALCGEWEHMQAPRKFGKLWSSQYFCPKCREEYQ